LKDAPHIDLARDGSGDERGSAFLQQVDGALGLGGEDVEFGGFGFQNLSNFMLLIYWWNGT
jgi:hypothetical protein